MDYKYIEQLLDRYFEAETTLKEEQILKAFFEQSEEELPESLRQYKPLFAAITNHDGYVCGKDFLYPTYWTIRQSGYTPDESMAGTIKSLLAENWDERVSDFNRANCGPLTEKNDYFIDRDHAGGFLNMKSSP